MPVVVRGPMGSREWCGPEVVEIDVLVVVDIERGGVKHVYYLM